MFRPGPTHTVPRAGATYPTYSPRDSEVTAQAAGARVAAADGPKETPGTSNHGTDDESSKDSEITMIARA